MDRDDHRARVQRTRAPSPDVAEALDDARVGSARPAAAASTTLATAGTVRGSPVLSGRDVVALQRAAGNRAVVATLQREVVEEGQAGTGAVPGEPVHEEAVAADPAPVAVNEFGEIDVAIVSSAVPHLFKNKGKKGSGLVNWAGGDGGAGQQTTGSVDLVAPVYESAEPAKAGRSARAWVRSGTGKATVTRSYKGVQKGANNAYYFTARACARADVHEKQHVSSSKTIHDATIKPLEKRVSKHRGKGSALETGATGADALAALQGLIDWNTAVTTFAADDTVANTPSGTVDTLDLARADFVRDYGPRAVKGTNYAHYIDTPPGP